MTTVEIKTEIRKVKGDLDEIVLKVDGRVILHLERMSDKSVWLRIDQTVVEFFAKGRLSMSSRIDAHPQENIRTKTMRS